MAITIDAVFQVFTDRFKLRVSEKVYLMDYLNKQDGRSIEIKDKSFALPDFLFFALKLNFSNHTLLTMVRSVPLENEQQHWLDAPGVMEPLIGVSGANPASKIDFPGIVRMVNVIRAIVPMSDEEINELAFTAIENGLTEKSPIRDLYLSLHEQPVGSSDNSVKAQLGKRISRNIKGLGHYSEDTPVSFIRPSIIDAVEVAYANESAALMGTKAILLKLVGHSVIVSPLASMNEVKEGFAKALIEHFLIDGYVPPRRSWSLGEHYQISSLSGDSQIMRDVGQLMACVGLKENDK